jgi:uncharacterized protein (TIGR04255 family)
MAKQRHLENAPVREALIDFRFSPEVPIDLLERWVLQWAEGRGPVRKIVEGTFAMELGGAGLVASNEKSSVNEVGRRVDCEGGEVVVQFRTSGFTYSRLPKYKDWEEIKGPALLVWQEFCHAMGVTGIVRLALRYINGLEVPLPLPEATGFGHFLTCPPMTPDGPDGVPRGVAGFMTRIVVPVDDQTTLVVSQVLEGPADNQTSLKLLLDIDVFEQGQYSPSSEVVGPALERLRTVKNDAFFGSLTEATVELYQ